MLNKCTFIGNMGRDPEIRTLQNGKQVASFSLAVKKSWKDKNTGEKKEKTEWINCTSFNAAKIIGDYTRKGSKIYIESEFTLETYQDKDGNEKKVPKFIVSMVQLLDSKNTQQRQGGYHQNTQAPIQQQPLDDSEIPF